jgi:hypothetical protein
MNADQNLEPDPSFVDRLERQLASEWRHSAASRRGRIRTHAPKLATVVLSILAGYGASLAARHYLDSSDKELLLAEASAAVELAEARLGLAETQFAEVQKQVSAGQVDATSLAVSDLELSQIRRELERTRLDYQEIQASGNPVRNQLSAPLVTGRDFVSERLRLELAALHDRVRMTRATLQQAEREVATGVSDGRSVEHMQHEISADSSNDKSGRKGKSIVSDERSVGQMQHEISMWETEMRDVEQQLDLRASYLAGTQSAQEVAARARLFQARSRLEGAMAKSAMTRANADIARRSFSMGTLPSLDLKHVEFEVIASDVEERLARLEVQHLERQLQKKD